MFDNRYLAQVRLLLRCQPEVARQTCFALKGGTAINLFVQDMPRISVDIDLAYTPLKPRSEALAEINAAIWKLMNIPRMDERKREAAYGKLARIFGD